MSQVFSNFRSRSACTVVALALLSAAAGMAQVTLSIASGSAAAGGAASLDILLNSSAGNSPAAVEWIFNSSTEDLNGLTLRAGPVAIAAGKSLSCGTDPGAVHCVLSGLSGTTVANGVIATASFTVSSTAGASSVVEIAGAKAASLAGAGVGAVGSSGTLTITSSTSSNHITKLSCTPASLVPPATTICTVTLASAGVSPVKVTLGLTGGATNLTLPASITLPAGATSATFSLQAAASPTATNAVVVATLDGSSVSVSIPLQPQRAIKALACTPGSLLTPGSATCTVSLTQSAASGGAIVALKLGAAVSAITMPSTVTVPAGASSATFSLKAAVVTLSTKVSIIASLNGTSQSYVLTLTTSAPPPALRPPAVI